MNNNEEAEDLKSMALDAGLSTIVNPQMMEALKKIMPALTDTAWKALLDKMKDGKYKYLVFADPDYGLIIQRLDMEVTEINGPEPVREDLTILKKEELSDLPGLLKKVTGI